MPQQLLPFSLSAGEIIPSFIVTYSILSQALVEKLRKSKALEFLYVKMGPLRKVDIGGKVSA